MPLYEYLCEACGRRTELLQSFGDPPLATCPHCGGAVKKQFSAPSFQFKGSGWYVTDYAKKSGGGEGAKSGESKAESAGSASSKSESSKSGSSAASESTSDGSSASAAAKPASDKSSPAAPSSGAGSSDTKS